MEDREILDCIHALVAQARRLRDQRGSGLPGEGADPHRLGEIEENLDQMWELLRRRRALRAEGVHPGVIDLRTSVPLSLALP